MPAFFCLSGVLLAKQIDRGKWKNGYGLLKDKFKRLIIPMLLVWGGWNIPIKYISGYFSNSITGLSFIKHTLVQIIFPTNVYLWFLQALFVGSILLYYIKKINSLKAQFIVAVVLWRLHYVVLVRVGSPYQMCGGAFQYVIWLWLGSVIEKMIPRSKLGKTICLMLIVILSATYQLLPSGKLEMYFKGLLIPFSFILSLWIIAEMVFNRQSKIGNGAFFKTILNHSFDIYLFAEPINFLILHWFLEEGGLGILGSEGGSVFVYFLRIIVSVAVALGIGKMRKYIVDLKREKFHDKGEY